MRQVLTQQRNPIDPWYRSGAESLYPRVGGQRFRMQMNAGPSRGPNRSEVSMLNSIIGLLVLIADIWAIINIVQSSVSNGSKALWVVLVLILPVLGVIIWYFAGPKSASA
jgi:hypothetical protein